MNEEPKTIDEMVQEVEYTMLRMRTAYTKRVAEPGNFNHNADFLLETLALRVLADEILRREVL